MLNERGNASLLYVDVNYNWTVQSKFAVHFLFFLTHKPDVLSWSKADRIVAHYLSK